MTENKATYLVVNNKLQGSVATYCSCGGIFSFCMNTNMLLSLLATEENFKICEHLV